MSTAATTDRLLSSREAAELLGLREQTLSLWRCVKRQPQPTYVKIGSRAVKYRLRDLEAFIERGVVGGDPDPQ